MGWNSLPSTTCWNASSTGVKSVALDAKDGGDNFIVERLPQFVDRGDRVVEDEQGIEARAMQGGNGPAEDGIVAAGIVQLAAKVAIACRMIGWPSRIKA